MRTSLPTIRLMQYAKAVRIWSLRADAGQAEENGRAYAAMIELQGRSG